MCERLDALGLRVDAPGLREQVEEERTMAALLDLIDSGINLFQAQEHLEGIGE